MKITVIGCGRWGSFLANYLDSVGHDVTLYGRESSRHMQELLKTRRNPLMTLRDTVKLSTVLDGELLACDVLLVSVASQALRTVLADVRTKGYDKGTLVLCMKGLEIESGKRLSVIAREEMGDGVKVAVWIGPGHVQEFSAGIPNCMVIDSEDEATKKRLVEEFASPLIRFYYGEDLIGNEIGAAAKNVIGIAAGFLDGAGLSTLKGALMSRGTREIARLITALGGNELSAYGLCHLGDYEATVFSAYSHNRRFGEAFVRGEPFADGLAEGYYTVRALMKLSRDTGVELPICQTVEALLYHGLSPDEALARLFGRSLKRELS